MTADEIARRVIDLVKNKRDDRVQRDIRKQCFGGSRPRLYAAMCEANRLLNSRAEREAAMQRCIYKSADCKIC